jgi:hypothetical protein
MSTFVLYHWIVSTNVFYLHPGTAFCKKLLGYNAVTIVLDVLKRQRIPSKVIELSLLALQKFVDIPEGRLAFMNGGVEILVSVLRVGVLGKSPSINSLTTLMLVSYPHRLLRVLRNAEFFSFRNDVELM